VSGWSGLELKPMAKQIPEVVREPRKVPATGSGSSVARTFSSVSELEGNFAAHFAKLQAIENNPASVPVGSDAPSGDSIAFADRVLRYLLQIDFVPSRVATSAEGGVAISFMKGDMYSDIECLNSGEILGVTSNRKDRPTVWELERDEGGIARAVARIRKFFDAQTPETHV